MAQENDSAPNVIVIGGPNGAGKSTIAPLVLSGTLAVTEFVNADVIAQGLSAFQPEREATQAGRIMLRRLDELAAAREDFAFETTLASRTFAPWIRRIRGQGYQFHLAYVWLPDAELAVTRVGMRVKSGGHYVPDETVRRRYRRGSSISSSFTSRLRIDGCCMIIPNQPEPDSSRRRRSRQDSWLTISPDGQK